MGRLLTPAQREEKNARARARYAAMTPEQREMIHIRNRNWHANLTPEQRTKKNAASLRWYKELEPDKRAALISRQTKRNQKYRRGLHGWIAMTIRNIQRRNHRRFEAQTDIAPATLFLMWKQQRGRCHYTGHVMTPEPNRWNTVSLDRVASNKPYTRGNVVLCCTDFNLSKLDLSIAELYHLYRPFIDRYHTGVATTQHPSE